MWSLVVLGSGQDGGLPQFGARTPLDEAARRGDVALRYSSSVAVVGDDGRVLLLDAGPDIKANEHVLLDHLESPRHSREPVDGVVLTHAHIGHYAGLIQFGREAHASSGTPCWVSRSMADFLTSNAPWRLAVEQGHLDVRPVAPPGEFQPWDDLTIRLIPVPHRHEASDTVAISVEGRALYLPDIDSWEDWEEADEVVAAHEVALLDATFWSGDELPHRDMGEIGHPLVPETLDRFGHLAQDRRLVLTHLNHTNPVCDPSSAEHAEVLAAGFEVASEGMTLRL